MNSKFLGLLDKEYIFLIGRKGQIREIRVVFDKKDYHHLAGFHYLTDIRELKQDRGKVFDMISSGQITKDTIEKSDFYDDFIAGRIDALDELEKLLDRNDIVLRYNTSAKNYSKIRFDYLLECNDTYIFLKEDGEIYRCISIFRIGSVDYTSGHTKWTLLRKVKKDNSSGTEEILYERNKVINRNASV